MGQGGACAEADGGQYCGGSFGKSCVVSQLTMSGQAVPWWLFGETGEEMNVEGAGAVGLSHRWQPFEMDSPHSGPPGKGVVGDSSMQPVRAGRVLSPPHPALGRHNRDRAC